MDHLTKINSVEEYAEAIKQKSCIMFSATWCPDCTYTKMYIADVVEKNPEFTFYLVDRDELLDLCIELGILGIPSFITYEDGKETGRFVSKLRKTQEEVQHFLDSVK